MNLQHVAIFSQLGLHSYWLVTEWVDLFPWNDIKSAKREDQIKGTIFHTTTTSLAVLGFLFQIRVLMGAALVWFVIMLAVEIGNWWVPYLFGMHPAEVTREIYTKQFSRTYRFLPPIKNHNVVDAQHVVVCLLTLATVIFSGRALLATI